MEKLIQNMIDENTNISEFIVLWESFEANKIVNEELNNHLKTYIDDNKAYCIENIFKIVKLDNHACGVHFIPTSKSYNEFGEFVCIKEFVCSDEEYGLYSINCYSDNKTYGSFKAILFSDRNNDNEKVVELSTYDIFEIENP